MTSLVWREGCVWANEDGHPWGCALGVLVTVISHKAMTMCSLSLELLVFSQPRVSESTSGKNLGGCATLGFSPWLIPPHSVAKHYTNSLRSCIVTMTMRSLELIVFSRPRVS